MGELHGPGDYGSRRVDSAGDEGKQIKRSMYKDPSKVLMLFVSLEKYSEGFFLLPITIRRAFFGLGKSLRILFILTFCVSHFVF